MSPRSGEEGDKPLTVAQALERYREDLKLRGGDTANVSRLERRLGTLAGKRVAELTAGELRRWRDRLATMEGEPEPAEPSKNRRGRPPLRSLSAASISRTCGALKAALNVAADVDRTVLSREPWKQGLRALPNAQRARNVVVSDDVISQIIVGAGMVSPEFGLLVETAAATGARYRQLCGLRVSDLQDVEGTPRLLVPGSRKGKSERRPAHRPVPISVPLARKLWEKAKSRHQGAPLLIKPDGAGWQRSDHSRLFSRAVKLGGVKAEQVEPFGLDEVTLYSLRHSSITRHLLRGDPVRAVAAKHDTSVPMVEAHYSHFITDHADAILRASTFEFRPVKVSAA